MAERVVAAAGMERQGVAVWVAVGMVAEEEEEGQSVVPAVAVVAGWEAG